MCGRATLVTGADEIAEIFEAPPIDIGPPRYNLAPSQPLVAVRTTTEGGARELAMLRWGLIPWWAKADETKKIASRCIQARAETAPRAAAFREAFRRHRCLIVVDGFFEWKTLADGRRIPHHARERHGSPLALAGLWDSWRAKDAPTADKIESAAVLTTRSAGAIHDLHDRMPLVLSADQWNTWLAGTPEEAAALLTPDDRSLEERARELVVVPVSPWVNDVRHDDPRCIEPAEIEPAAGQLGLGFSRRSR